MLKSIRKPKSDKVSSSALAAGASSVNMDALLGKSQTAPPDQLKLSPVELDQEFTRILNSTNPAAPQNISRWNAKERTFKTLPFADHLMVHFEYEGNLQFKGIEGDIGYGEDGGASELAANVERRPPPARNHFNYSQRFSQTPALIQRESGTCTEPPPQRVFSGCVNQMTIYDSYKEHLAHRDKARDKAKLQATVSTSNSKKAETVDALSAGALMSMLGDGQGHHEDFRTSGELKHVVSIIERMCNQNTYNDIIMDFRYWEDAADEFREGKGVLLPLWKFSFELERKKQVTAIAWHPEKRDFFAASYGSYDFGKQSGGVIVCYSVKNPSFPDFILRTDTGVMCLMFHPVKTSWIAAGLYDGSVAIFDLTSSNPSVPLYKSTFTTGKHTDPVWEIRWQANDLNDNMTFLTVSTDGRVTQWAVLKNELSGTDIIVLRKSPGTNGKSADDSNAVLAISGATCFDINPTNPDMLVVGTEDGRLMRCSKAYNSQYVTEYDGHQLGVYAIKYNQFCSRFFVSASADWNVKLWDEQVTKPILFFDFGQSVGDIYWSPFSSTVFHGVTSDGRVVTYDISVSKYEPISDQAVTKKSKLTHLSVCKFHPVVLIGDDAGQVLSFKLSPNLRKIKGHETQEEKLVNIINSTMGKAST